MSPDQSTLRLIWIAPKFPLGVPDGARHATSQLLRHLSGAGVQIDLICLTPHGDEAEESQAKKQLGVRSCTVIRRGNSRLWPLPTLAVPFTFRTFMASSVRRALDQQLRRLLGPSAPSTRELTFVVFDGLHAFSSLTAASQAHVAASCNGIVYRAHNVETVLWEQCEKRAGHALMRWFFRHQANLVRRVERDLVARSISIAAVSEDDAQRFQQMVPTAHAYAVPIGMDFPRDPDIQPVRNGTGLEVLFVGRLDWIPNRSGLQWFLDKVWPAVMSKRPDAALKIVGSGNGEWLKAYAGHAGVSALGRVADIEPLYQACALTIAPIFQGSGTRVKILEAARYKRAALTTALGAEGSGLIPGESYYRAETVEEWIACLQQVSIEDCRQRGLNALACIRPRFDGQLIARQFIDALVQTGR